GPEEHRVGDVLEPARTARRTEAERHVAHGAATIWPPPSVVSSRSTSPTTCCVFRTSARETKARTNVHRSRVTARPSSAERVRPTLLASRKLLAIFDGIVAAGANKDARICAVFPITIVTAIVSPSARPSPSIVAPTMPLLA